ncbi:50S ribosomal protein L14e [Candidatus Woesearchaeota archaeon]|nr:50S ribosomal protein L14e [Candidatus Woesearchaeota archaeon]
MGLFEVGRVCVKIAGRDARKKCVVIEVLDNTFVMVDGETRRRKCNVAHLEPLNMAVELSSGADNAAVVAALKDVGIVCTEKKAASKGEKEKPKKQKAVKKGEAKPKAEKAKPAEKNATKKKE